MSLKSPFELVGAGELGSVILVVCLEQVALTGRLSNLVLRAPWFTNFVLKVRSGYLQLDSCIVEDGMMYVQNPGTCHVRFCTFRHATIILQHVNSSIVRNCEFSQSDNANVIVEENTVCTVEACTLMAFMLAKTVKYSDGAEAVPTLITSRLQRAEEKTTQNCISHKQKKTTVSADVGSICSQTTRPITFSASQDEGVLSYVNKVRGCLIHQCRMIHSKGGVMVLVLKNRNDIHSNNEAGIDIRKSADPIIQYNRVHHGKRSGIVVLGSGRGQIRNNDIFSNTEADNTISGNQWGGVDIRRGSCPMVCRNTITNGLGDGIVIGDQGQGTIENNVISGRGVAVELGDTVDIMFNAIYANQHDGLWVNQDAPVSLCGNSISSNRGCGVIIAQASCMQVAGNGIYDNRDCGIHCHSNADIMENDVVGNHTGGIILESKHSNKGTQKKKKKKT
nr:hypothetical protein BaRGS_011184 [Batillaria attramentaria]